MTKNANWWLKKLEEIITNEYDSLRATRVHDDRVAFDDGEEVHIVIDYRDGRFTDCIDGTVLGTDAEEVFEEMADTGYFDNA